MSDLLQTIASSSIQSFNEGYTHGAQQERERISELLKGLQAEFQRSYQLERYIAVAVKRINE
jgi:hypothetical protein